MVPENIPTTEGIGNSEGVGGSKTQEILERRGAGWSIWFPDALQFNMDSSIDLAVQKSEQGWRSGESARLPPMCPGFDSRTRRHMWVEFVVGSLLCSERFFSGYSGFSLSSKIIIIIKILSYLLRVSRSFKQNTSLNTCI